jgi:catechol 2,3-dioxygenase
VTALARLGHVALRTPDLEGSLHFFDDILGLEVVERDHAVAYLRAWGDFEHHTLALISADEARLDHAGWRTRAPEDVEALSSRLREQGVEVEEVAAGQEAGQGAAVRFHTPGGLPYEIYHEVDKRPAPAGRRPALKTNSGRVWDHGVSPRRLHQNNYLTPEGASVVGWSRQTLGFSTRERALAADGGVHAAWLAVSALAHDLAIGRGPAPGVRGLHHVAFYVDNASDVLRAAELMVEHGLEADHGPGRHAISQAVCLYVRDPASGHRVEIYSGSYIVLDPDWEPVDWTADEYRQWWGAQPVRHADSPIDVVTPC